MFRLLRRRATLFKWLLIFFFGVIAVSMVISLAPLPSGDTSASEANVLAKIGGQTITTQDLDRNVRQRLQSMTGKYSSQMASALATPMLDEMVLERAVELQASKLGLTVTDQEVIQAAQAIPGLYVDGKFIGNDRFVQIAGITVDQFQSEMRDGLLTQKMRSVITDAVSVTPDEVHREFLRRNSKVKIEYVTFDPSKYLSAVKITPNSLEDFYKKGPDTYKVPEERKVRYVLISADRLLSQIQISEQELKQYYSGHLADYRVPERVRVEHILFKTTEKTPAEVATLEKTAQDVLGQVKAGKNFEDLAKEYSEDSSASQGGMIGWITRGQTVKEFEDTAFSLKPGAISGLIKTQYGIHIVKVLDTQTAHLQTFDEVKADILQTLGRQKLDDAQRTMAGKLEGEFKTNPQKFQEVAKQEGLEVHETPLFRFQQVVPDFGNSESFANLAFQLRPGEVGPPITLPKGVAIIQLMESVPSHVPPLDEIRAQVEEDYRAAQSKVLATEKAKDFAAKARSGDFKSVARAEGLAVKDSKEFTASDFVEGLGSAVDLTGAFKLDPGKGSDVVSLNNYDAVYRVVSRTPADESNFASQEGLIAETLLQQKRQLTFELYRQSLKKRFLESGELKINEAALKQFLATYRSS